MTQALPFLIPIAVFFGIGLIARVAVLRELKRVDKSQSEDSK